MKGIEEGLINISTFQNVYSMMLTKINIAHLWHVQFSMKHEGDEDRLWQHGTVNYVLFLTILHSITCTSNKSIQQKI